MDRRGLEMEPHVEDVETALSVLLWLHQRETNGYHRDEISEVRHTLAELLDDLGGDDLGNPSAQELLNIIDRARADRVRREAMDRYWQSVCEALPEPSEWPCRADRRRMASHHEPSCPIQVAEMIGRKK